ncbi:MAG: ankyrin repeat protein, partial [Lysobacterales bacterium]
MKLVKAILKSIGFIWAGSIIGSLYWNDRFFTLAFNPLQGIYTYGTYYGGDGYIYLIWLQGIVGGSIFGFVVYLLWQNYKLKGMVLPAILITTVFIHHVVTLKLDFWPRKEFYHAAKDGDKETLSRLISRKESWIYYESWGDPVKQENSKDIPLITLIKNNHIDLALKFLEMGGNPNEYNSFDRARALNYAIKKLYFIDNQEAKETNQDPMILRLIHKLIDAGADIDFKSKLAKKPILVEAIINNDRQLVKVLLEARANPNLYYTSLFEVYKIKNQYVMGKRTKSICQLVAEQGEPEIYSLVVEKNCLNTENDLLSIYRSAFIRKKIPHLEESEIINLLESTKNNQSKFLGEVYLPAIDNNYDRVIDWLLAKSIKPLGANKEGYDAILLAIERKKYDLARKLIDWTDHLDQVTFVEEKTAAILAIEHRRLDILEEILERNFEVQTKGPINAWS